MERNGLVFNDPSALIDTIWLMMLGFNALVRYFPLNDAKALCSPSSRAVQGQRIQDDSSFTADFTQLQIM